MAETDSYVKADASGQWFVIAPAAGLDEATATGQFIMTTDPVEVTR